MGQEAWASAEDWLDAVQQQERDLAAGAPSLVPDLFGLFSGPNLKGALCRELPPHEQDAIFYPEVHGQPRVTVSSLVMAREICSQCPVMVGCLKGAIERNERIGIWAGTSRRTRLRIRVAVAEGRTTLGEVLLDFALGFTARWDQLTPPIDEEDPA